MNCPCNSEQGTFTPSKTTHTCESRILPTTISLNDLYGSIVLLDSSTATAISVLFYSPPRTRMFPPPPTVFRVT